MLLLLVVKYLIATEVQIQTRLGKVTGVSSTVLGQQVNVFRGIPYAKPPIGDLRLAKPQPYGSFLSSELNATEFGEVCAQAQYTLKGGEDCLFLNIYSPQTNGLKNVMIWIHGGGLSTGESNTYNGGRLAAVENVVVVTINYRLNLFGFLTTGESELPGNYGFWDQRLAIQWVKENIDDYGGQGSAITIFGESAGGRSVGFQMMSPQNNRDLFQRAITESGSSLSLTYINRNPMTITEQVAKNLSCDAKKSDFLHCLRSKTTKELQIASSCVDRPFSFFAVVDNDFIPYDLGSALSNFTMDNSFVTRTEAFGNFGKYDVFSGWNDQDGLLYMGSLQSVSLQMTGANISKGISIEVLTEALKQWPFVNYPNDQGMKDFVVNTFIDFYMNTPEALASDKRSIEDRRVEVYSRVSGDVSLKIPNVQHLQVHRAANLEGVAYAYEFIHKRSNNPTPWYEGPDWLRYGADHTDEMPYVFGEPLITNDQSFTPEEKNLSKNMMRMWANFAKYGNPGPEFSKFTYPKNQAYTILNTGGFVQKNYPLNDVQRLWSSVDNTILQQQGSVTPSDSPSFCLSDPKSCQ
ncbi:carboxylesterase 1C-like [Watersipora subatra]|uniref:carboxylesterase 1C-like n=1 Tax=Watersipora subatra TaxID=2589382 RepID=UPI00355B9BDC